MAAAGTARAAQAHRAGLLLAAASGALLIGWTAPPLLGLDSDALREDCLAPAFESPACAHFRSPARAPVPLLPRTGPPALPTLVIEPLPPDTRVTWGRAVDLDPCLRAARHRPDRPHCPRPRRARPR